MWSGMGLKAAQARMRQAAQGRITALDTYDIRFPTSRRLAGSDAMHSDPDYSAAYVIIRTDAANGPEGHGFCFTIGRGNEVEVAAIDALRPLLVGRSLDELRSSAALSPPSRARSSRDGSALSTPTGRKG